MVSNVLLAGDVTSATVDQGPPSMLRPSRASAHLKVCNIGRHDPLCDHKYGMLHKHKEAFRETSLPGGILMMIHLSLGSMS